MKIALLGYGKMGKTIEGLAKEKGHQIVLRVNHPQEMNLDLLRQAEVAIEFSNPEAAFDNISTCIKNGVPVVSGTTGWLDKMSEAKALCQQSKAAFFYASNYSVGVNIFFAINQKLADLMKAYPNYEIQMEEIHHTQKLDAPSGTAITLANQILDAVEHKKNWVNQPAAEQSELSIISKRIDKVPGTHSIQYESAIDRISIEHVAHSRLGFASGALLAAEWIIGKEGCFGMQDLLNI